ncbi:MAG: tetratricopeptide repeat protein, partial [Candidatus Marinimicrobia bacterium]|nr:tetratricopeptide repeat protein [Candidatus Neomarinimicrobiota bacterium]
ILSFSFSLFTGMLLMAVGITGVGQIILGTHIVGSILFIVLIVLQYDIEIGKATGIVIAIILLLFIGKSFDVSLSNASNNPADFSPSPGSTVSGGYIAIESINRSARCGTSGCHPDIYEQWNQSAHRNSSFNNPFYKASVEYLLETADSTTVRWCGSCHDPVMLYSGLMETGPQMDIPEASSGITCEVCHGMVDIPDITGNSNYILDSPIEYPFSHSSGILGTVNKLLIKLKPQAHSKGFLNPIHTGEKFCATCHKVSLDVEINNYKWLRGQDEYDAWQASGVSYNAVASFYNPPVPLDCRNCHMYNVPSQDMGNNNGIVKSHYFPAANTAMPSLPSLKNIEWLNRTTQFLKGDRVSVDIFGAVVDGELIAPLNNTMHVKPGQKIRFEVVVRTKNIGHTFPGGTIDSNEPWLSLLGKDDEGKTIFSSGLIQQDKTVDPKAHFFRGALLDGRGEFILKRNPHEWRTTLYNNSIPPGSADAIHFTWTVPENFTGAINLTAKLNYRKFNRSITVHSLDDPVDLPIITMAEDYISLSSFQNTELAENAGMRYNDYGIAMLRQKNLAASRRAFEKVTELIPGYADGFVNVARVLIKEGKFEKAKDQLKIATELNPDWSKAKYFKALIAKIEGRYNDAFTLFEDVRKTNPNDRVMLKQFGQTHYFSENWTQAHSIYIDVLRIDPEDADAHYNLMLINRKLGDLGQAKYHSEKYLKYKPDEQARSISQIARLKFPHANNEAQPVHSHELQPIELD